MPKTKDIVDRFKALVEELEGALGEEESAIFAQNFDA